MITGLKDRKDIIKFFLDRGAKHTVFKMGAEGSSVAGQDMDGSAFRPLSQGG